jgi:hypothetical protein
MCDGTELICVISPQNTHNRPAKVISNMSYIRHKISIDRGSSQAYTRGQYIIVQLIASKIGIQFPVIDLNH